MLKPTFRDAQGGAGIIEILMTLVILAFGLLGLAGVQSRSFLAEMESYQRSQALLLLNDMTERINASRLQAASYVTTATLGTDHTPEADCGALALGPARDRCEWSKALQGASESSTAKGKLGAMVGARGCITEIQAANPATGVCQPGIYRVTVAWQGTSPSATPSDTCGQNSYGAESYRRTVSTQLVIGTPGCI